MLEVEKVFYKRSLSFYFFSAANYEGSSFNNVVFENFSGWSTPRPALDGKGQALLPLAQSIVESDSLES